MKLKRPLLKKLLVFSFIQQQLRIQGKRHSMLLKDLFGREIDKSWLEIYMDIFVISYCVISWSSFVISLWRQSHSMRNRQGRGTEIFGKQQVMNIRLHQTNINKQITFEHYVILGGCWFNNFIKEIFSCIPWRHFIIFLAS